MTSGWGRSSSTCCNGGGNDNGDDNGGGDRPPPPRRNGGGDGSDGGDDGDDSPPQIKGNHDTTKIGEIDGYMWYKDHPDPQANQGRMEGMVGMDKYLNCPGE